MDSFHGNVARTEAFNRRDVVRRKTQIEKRPFALGHAYTPLSRKTAPLMATVRHERP